jgi:hypothetical protein
LQFVEFYDNGGKRGDCRACWDKNVPIIAYVMHGRKVTKILKEAT